MLTVMVILKSVYGAEKIYPANDAAHALASIAGTKTLSPAVLAKAKAALGAAVVTLEADKAAVAKMIAEAA